jgi:DNA-binding transcriptional regulator PaaX
VSDRSQDEASKSSAESENWLVLIYKVPSEPTRLRATVWRRLKGLGAIYLQNSVAALPAGGPAERALRKLRNEILEMAGTAVLLRSPILAGGAEVSAAFAAARDDEYDEIIDKCQDFLAGIEKEFKAEHFSFAELEENEVDYTKLITWLTKVRARDALGASQRAAAEVALGECEVALAGYAERVYAEDPSGH